MSLPVCSMVDMRSSRPCTVLVRPDAVCSTLLSRPSWSLTELVKPFVVASRDVMSPSALSTLPLIFPTDTSISATVPFTPFMFSSTPMRMSSAVLSM